MKIQDLGELTGDILLFGGPYSNRQATEALLDVAGSVPRGNVICTGDVVAYCGDPMGTIAAIRDHGVHVVAGNCEKQLAIGADDCGCGFEDGSTCDLLSAGWYAHASAVVTDEARAWMAECPDVLVFLHAGHRVAVLHGGITDIARFLWPTSLDEAFRDEIAALTQAVGPVDQVIAGHAGLAFQRVVDGVVWTNAGVIGMPPHDGRATTRFAILSDDGARFHHLEYDVAGAVADMEAAGLTQGYHLALQSGIWPSEDVLPPELRRL